MTVDTLSTLLTVLLQLFAVALGGLILFGVRAAIETLRLRLGETQAAIVWAAVVDAIRAVEHSTLAGIIQKQANVQKAQAIAWAQAILKARGVKIDVAALDGLIEAAIAEGLHKLPAEIAPASTQNSVSAAP
jgi:hypothetical protein